MLTPKAGLLVAEVEGLKIKAGAEGVEELRKVVQAHKVVTPNRWTPWLIARCRYRVRDGTGRSGTAAGTASRPCGGRGASGPKFRSEAEGCLTQTA
jgi:hypothetical protein